MLSYIYLMITQNFLKKIHQDVVTTPSLLNRSDRWYFWRAEEIFFFDQPYYSPSPCFDIVKLKTIIWLDTNIQLISFCIYCLQKALTRKCMTFLTFIHHYWMTILSTVIVLFLNNSLLLYLYFTSRKRDACGGDILCPKSFIWAE